MKQDLPKFKAFTDGVNSFFWCPNPLCRKWHIHGHLEGDFEQHCVPDTIFEDGYELRFYDKTELKLIMKWCEYMLGVSNEK